MGDEPLRDVESRLKPRHDGSTQVRRSIGIPPRDVNLLHLSVPGLENSGLSLFQSLGPVERTDDYCCQSEIDVRISFCDRSLRPELDDLSDMIFVSLRLCAGLPPALTADDTRTQRR